MRPDRPTTAPHLHIVRPQASPRKAPPPIEAGPLLEAAELARRTHRITHIGSPVPARKATPELPRPTQPFAAMRAQPKQQQAPRTMPRTVPQLVGAWLCGLAMGVLCTWLITHLA